VLDIVIIKQQVVDTLAFCLCWDSMSVGNLGMSVRTNVFVPVLVMLCRS